jgi:Flp pilus assembly protein TadG
VIAMLKTTSNSIRSAPRGTVAALTALLMPAVVGVMALTLDGGLLYLQRRQAQSAADAAALAGAYALYKGSDFSTAQSAAVAIAAQNGLTITSSQVTQPQSGNVAVSVTSTQPRYFSALWGSGSMSATASGTAQGASLTPYSTAAILALNPSGSAVTLSGTTAVSAVGGAVIVDSNSAASVISSGTASITAPVLDLSGGIQYSGSNPNKATVTNTNQTSTPDPLSTIPAPSSSGMTVQSSSSIALSGSMTRTLNPGVYNGGITLSGSASVTLNPGVYYINGGGINLSNLTSITGNGVFIYNTGGGAINLSGSGTISLNPMNTGTYAGLTVFQDRSSTVGATMSGGSNIKNTGTFYYPSATLTLSGSSGVSNVGAQVIAKNLTFSGMSSIKVTYGSSVASKPSTFALIQ